MNAIAVGGNFACAIRGGAVWCWGDDRDGQLGDNALRDDASVACWGLGSSGQLGDG